MSTEPRLTLVRAARRNGATARSDEERAQQKASLALASFTDSAATRKTIMTTMSPVVHFEMPADDSRRIASFYENAFGWKTQMLGPDMGDYVLVTTAESDAKPGAPAGAINGGFFPKKPDWPAQYPSIVIAVDDIDAAMRLVGEAGGKVLGEPIEIPGVGRYVSFFDTEGNRASMLQPDRNMG